jgi:hypothetical protein
MGTRSSGAADFFAPVSGPYPVALPDKRENPPELTSGFPKDLALPCLACTAMACPPWDALRRDCPALPCQRLAL